MEIVIKGKQGEGKTRLVRHTVDYLLVQGFTVSVFDEGKIVRYEPSSGLASGLFAIITVSRTPKSPAVRLRPSPERPKQQPTKKTQ